MRQIFNQILSNDAPHLSGKDGFAFTRMLRSKAGLGGRINSVITTYFGHGCQPHQAIVNGQKLTEPGQRPRPSDGTPRPFPVKHAAHHKTPSSLIKRAYVPFREGGRRGPRPTILSMKVWRGWRGSSG